MTRSPAPAAAGQTVDAVRHFSRFYTRQLGLLDEGLLASDFSLSESRILFELAQRRGMTASDFVRELGMDAGYVSRILKSLRQRGLITARASAADARQSLLALSPQGRKAFKALDQGSRRQVASLIEDLTASQKKELASHMQKLERLLARPAAPRTFSLREHRIGDIGWVARRQGMLYAEEYGWDGTFEALVAEIAARFINKFDAQWERCWIAECEGEIVGSVFLVRQSKTVAKLRLLYVEPEARGMGLGARLTDECIRFARAKGYKTLTLWTNDVLVSARRIYVAAGFQLKSENRHHSFGKDMVGQHWDLRL